MKQTLYIFFISVLLCVSFSGYSQCLLDRHNTSYASHWVSCTSSQNPNPVRGVSHWLMFEFEEYKGIGEIQVWNINHPDYLDNGMNSIAIDVSYDGVSWTEAYTGNLPISEARSDYEGYIIPNYGGPGAKYMVITSLSNHGGSCHGLAEIKVNMTNFPCGGDVVNVPDDPVSAGVYAANLILNSDGAVQNDEVWMFGGQEVNLDSGFEVQVGSTFIASNDPCH